MDRSPWLVRSKPNTTARLRLYCLPYAGGGAAIFHKWPTSLPSAVEVISVQFPGRGARLKESPLDRIPHLVLSLAQALFPYLDRPFALFGHSMGALVGFELIRQLRKQHKPLPVHLFVSACRAPQLPDQDPLVHSLSDALFVEELGRRGGTPGSVLMHTELMQLLLPALRADFTARETYLYSDESPLECSISAFGGAEDRIVSRDDLTAWQIQTSAGFRLRMFPGDHFFLHTAEQLLLQVLSLELLKIQNGE